MLVFAAALILFTLAVMAVLVRMARQTQALLDEVYQQTILAQRAELKQLQAWIDPHFLYNSFFTIGNMARLGENESVKRFSEYLAAYYQYITKTDGAESVALAQEVEHSRIYVRIQQIRFGAALSVEFEELPHEAERWQTPRLVLQPLVENVFRHGFKAVEQQRLRVSFSLEGPLLTIAIEDNGYVTDETIETIRSSLATPETSSGLANVHKRLRLRYGEKAGVCPRRSELGGLCVKMVISKEGADAENIGG
jgi:two-component system sensor histidine kinase YesM